MDIISLIKKMEDIGVVIRATHIKDDIFVSYKIYLGNFQPDGTIYYLKKGSTYSPNDVETLEEAEIFISGTVKWDGCGDWNLCEDGYIHTCTLYDIEVISKSMKECYNWTKEFIYTDDF